MRPLQSLLLAILLILTPAFAKGARSSPSRSSSSRSRTASTTRRSSSNRVNVRGYSKKNGTRVQPHQRTAPNRTKRDNWSSKGNVNPNTGKAGTK